MFRIQLTSIVSLAIALASFAVHDVADALPQTKKTLRKSQPVPTSRAAPDVTATIPPRKPGTPPVDDEALPPPFYLPAAPRARIRVCGQKWEGIKMAGEAGNQTWRDFATRCLVEPGDPSETKR